MLTDTSIRKAKAKKAPYRLKDAKGLHLEVRPTGAKLWRYRYRIGGRENLYALGEYATVGAGEARSDAEARRHGGRFTLAEARLERDRARGLVKQGIHPAHDRELVRRQREHEKASTFEAVAREWLVQNAAHWGVRTLQQRERLLEREVFPEIGSLPVRDVTPAHVLSILKRLEKKAPSFAVIAQQAIGATFRLAVSTLRADSDPSASLKGSIRTPPTQHKTPLEAKEIPGFFRALDDYSGNFQTKAALRLVWLTLTRTNETLRAKWEEFDLDAATWKIPGKRMKGKTVNPHVLPLPTQAVDVLRRLHAMTGDGEYLFPNRSDNKRPAAMTLLNKAVSSMGYAGKFSPHAIRTTGSTMLNEQGFNGDWIERQLAHKHRNETRASYNGALYLEPRRDMMQQWADYLDALATGGNVVALNRKAA